MGLKINRLALLLSLLTFAITSTPVVIGGLEGIFYALDPDIMYLGNALSWIKMHQIHYIDHPGTPAIILLSIAYAPLRALSKLYFRVPFIHWALENHDIVFMYSRLFQSLVLSVSIYIFLKTIFGITKLNSSTLLSWLALTVFTPFFYLGSSISPETTSFLIVSVWVYIFARFLKKPSPLIVSALSLLAGVALANKFTNLALVIASPLLIFTLRKLSFKQKVYNLAINLPMTLLGFFFGTWTIRKAYPLMFRWVTRLATTSKLHGGGESTLFSWENYKNSALSILHLDTTAVIFTGISLLILVIITKRNTKFLSAQNIVFSTALLISFIFIKYPLSHYHLANYTIFIFLLAINLPALKRSLPLLLAVLLLPSFYSSVLRYNALVTSASSESRFLSQFIKNNPSKKATVWEWGRSNDMALLWGRGWSGGSYDPELSTLHPNLYQLKSDFQEIALSHWDSKPVFEVCWDHLYIQKVSTERFLNQYKDYPFKLQPIPQTHMNFIISDHCVTKP
jgi:hypothetical protein